MGNCPPFPILCTLYGPMSPLRPSVPSMAHVPSTTLSHLCGPLSPQGSSAPLQPFGSLQPSVLSTALCLLYSSFPLYGPLSPLRPSGRGCTPPPSCCYQGSHMYICRVLLQKNPKLFSVEVRGSTKTIF